MIVLVNPFNRHKYVGLLDQYYSLRHKTYNEWLKWDMPQVGGREFDAFDHDETVYILSVDGRGRLDAGTRLIPTTSKFMIPELFKEAWEGQDLPRTPEVWEFSRYAVDWAAHEMDQSAVRSVGASIACGVFEFCLMNGIQELLAILDAKWEPQVSRGFGEPSWRSEVHRFGTVNSVGVRYDVDYALLQRIRGKFTPPLPTISQYSGAHHV